MSQCFVCGGTALVPNSCDVNHKPHCGKCHVKLKSLSTCYICGGAAPSWGEPDVKGHHVCDGCFIKANNKSCPKCNIWHLPSEACPDPSTLMSFDLSEPPPVSSTPKVLPFKLTLPTFKTGDKVVIKAEVDMPNQGWEPQFGDLHTSVGTVFYSGSGSVQVHYRIVLKGSLTGSVQTWYIDTKELRLATSEEIANFDFILQHLDEYQKKLYEEEQERYKHLRLWGDIPHNQVSNNYLSKTSSREEVMLEWGLKRLNLSARAADYYLLLALNLDYPDNTTVKTKLNNLESLLARQFSRYLKAAIGGEIRHVRHAQYIKKSKGVPKDTPEIVFTLLSYIPGSALNRYQFWLEFKKILETHGEIPILEACKYLFSMPNHWEGAVGGKKWEVATQTLIDYLKGGSKRIFVDTAWGLQHNSTIIYDKIWKTDGVMSVLSANQQSLYTYLARNASAPTERLWASLKGGTL